MSLMLFYRFFTEREKMEAELTVEDKQELLQEFVIAKLAESVSKSGKLTEKIKEIEDNQKTMQAALEAKAKEWDE